MNATRQTETAERIPFDSAEQELYLNLWRTYDCLKALEERLFSQYQLSPQQYNLLRILQHDDPNPLPTLKLGQRLISRSPDITRMLDRLEKQGLIQRERRSENRRIVHVHLTDAGRQKLEEMAEPVRQMHAEQFGDLDENQQKALLQLLKAARGVHEDGSCSWLSE
ncbi:MAG: MarR family transcriptional regulator [Planctomyces sp.]|uniref:Transcriptional regulator, MarR family n=1 Tax=Rubinisphaera brasiliensis (strain ATCC 49424 / DSM 5305 / JCM 21570 / IAM 15109 / NBRC 103401 / IFAM 1448) TaxID=756272 RepID=F0SRE4_RUBBR|nr:MarR family transcriptional regulator [Rubinisphaera brasiliensis]ADY58005.1 transcriptional regulator, MarR family [Rubinisphaera brasiliensis DSM 5305]MBB02547.1 MarR family transcriptional regulator [Planctomyces sp.]